MSEHEFNPLTVGDVEMLISAVERVLTEARDEDIEALVSMFSSTGGPGEVSDEDAAQIGLVATRIATRFAQRETFAVLANVAGMAADEFRKQPADFAVKAVSAVIRDERNHGFFGELLSLFTSRTGRGKS